MKGLKKSDRYYYDKKHMPVVSGLLYRMEQNTVRLASIAISSTCVLVILSTTASLYSGMRVSLSRDYPEGLYFGAAGKIGGDAVYLPSPELLEDFFYKAAGGVGLEVERTEAQECLADKVAIHAKKFIAGTANVEFGMLQKAFANMLPEGGRILDLGCGSGRDSLAFLKAGLAVDAVDGSAEMVKAASELIGL